MSLLAEDYFDEFGSGEIGEVCPEAYFEWVSDVTLNCPVVYSSKICDEILAAFFKTDVTMFDDLFGNTVAKIIYEKGHFLNFQSDKCFIERRTIGFRKYNHQTGWVNDKDREFDNSICVLIEREEIFRIQIPMDILPDWPEGRLHNIKNPYYQGPDYELTDWEY